MAGDVRLFSLTENPFAQLGLTPRTSHDQISSARERGSAPWAVEVLLDPFQRLPEEAAWLPGASGQRAKEAVAALVSRDDARVRQAIQLLRGLAKANLSADAALRFSDLDMVESLARSWEAVDPAEVLDQINADRMISGFPQTNPAQVEWALQIVRQRHGATGARLFANAGDQGRDRLVRLVERPATSGHDGDVKLIDAMVAAYNDEISDALGQRETQMLAEVDAMTRGGREGTERLEGQLLAWSTMNRPALALARRRGRDDARALGLVGDMRTLYLDHSAGAGRVQAAGRIAALLLGQFPDSPAIQRMVGGDASRLGVAAPAVVVGATPESQDGIEYAVKAERARRQAAGKARVAAAGQARKSTSAVPASTQGREQLLAAVQARYQAQQAQAGATGQAAGMQGKKKGCGCSWIIPVGIVVFLIIRAIGNDGKDETPAPAAAPPPAAVEAPAMPAMPAMPERSEPRTSEPRMRPQIVPDDGQPLGRKPPADEEGPPTVRGEASGGGRERQP